MRAVPARDLQTQQSAPPDGEIISSKEHRSENGNDQQNEFERTDLPSEVWKVPALQPDCANNKQHQQ